MTARDLLKGDDVQLYNRKAEVKQVITRDGMGHVWLTTGWYQCPDGQMPQAFIAVERDGVWVWRKGE